MIRRPPVSTRPDTLFPYTTLFRSRPLLGSALVAHHSLRQHSAEATTARRLLRLFHLLGTLDGLERGGRRERRALRSEEHTSELQSLMRISYAVFCLKKKILANTVTYTHHNY